MEREDVVFFNCLCFVCREREGCAGAVVLRITGRTVQCNSVGVLVRCHYLHD